MIPHEKKELVTHLIPLEVPLMQIKCKRYKEMTEDFQDNLIKSIEKIRNWILSQEIATD